MASTPAYCAVVEDASAEDAAPALDRPLAASRVLRRAPLLVMGCLLMLCALPSMDTHRRHFLQTGPTWSGVTLASQTSGPGNRGVKVFQVLAQTSETCNDYAHLRLLKTLHNNLGGHGPDAGDEGLRYRARLEGVRGQEELIVDLHAPPSYHAAFPEHNGLSSSTEQVVAFTGHKLDELCDGDGCGDAMSFGSVNIPPDSSLNLTIAFYDLDFKPKLMDEISLTWFDLDHAGCAGPSPWADNCTALAVEYVEPRGDFSAYLSSTTQVKYHLAGDHATFSASLVGNVRDNPINSRLLTVGQMDKAVTSMYKEVHKLEVTLGATQGTTPRVFLFDFVPTLLCAETVKEWPKWMEGAGTEGAATAAPMTTGASTSTTITTTTTSPPGRCEACDRRVHKWAGKLGCVLQSGLCWLKVQCSWLWAETQKVAMQLLGWVRRSICDAAESGAAAKEVDAKGRSFKKHMKRMCTPASEWQETTALTDSVDKVDEIPRGEVVLS